MFTCGRRVLPALSPKVKETVKAKNRTSGLSDERLCRSDTEMLQESGKEL